MQGQPVWLLVNSVHPATKATVEWHEGCVVAGFDGHDGVHFKSLLNGSEVCGELRYDEYKSSWTAVSNAPR
jgi:hypothetical protein